MRRLLKQCKYMYLTQEKQSKIFSKSELFLLGVFAIRGDALICYALVIHMLYISLVWRRILQVIIIHIVSRYRTAPELGFTQPPPKKQSGQQWRGGSSGSPVTQQKIRQESPKHSRCKSVPGPLPEAVINSESEDFRKTSCPSSPLESSKDFLLERNENQTDGKRCVASGGVSIDGATGPDASPKPKKNIFDGFRNTLRKSKSDGQSSKADSYANSGQSMPDMVEGSDTRTSVGDSVMNRSSCKQGSTDSGSDAENYPVSLGNLNTTRR